MLRRLWISPWENPAEASLSKPRGAGVVVVALALVVGVRAERPEARSQPLAASARVPVEDLRRRREWMSCSSRAFAVVVSDVSSVGVSASPMEQWM